MGWLKPVVENYNKGKKKKKSTREIDTTREESEATRRHEKITRIRASTTDINKTDYMITN